MNSDIIEDEELFYRLALLSAGYIGDQGFKTLYRSFGSAKSVFKASTAQLQKIEGMGSVKINELKNNIDEPKIKKEINYIQKNDIQVHFIFDDTYPEKLKQLPDAPVIIFTKGNFNLHHPRQLAIVGTRHNTEYGRQVTQELIEQLVPYNVQIISGLAYGIDIIAHRHCVDLGVETVGVMAHGMDQIYPSAHKGTAQAMLTKGGLITEFTTGTKPDRFNFPMRNRIVAGLSDMTIVVESKLKGGALITAKLATSYHREVGAVPGRLRDDRSEGCHYLIKKNIGYMIESAKDIEEILGWDTQQDPVIQSRLFQDLNGEEQMVVGIIKEKDGIHIDELMLKSKMSYSHLAATLLNLELQHIIRSMSGKRYRLS